MNPLSVEFHLAVRGNGSGCVLSVEVGGELAPGSLGNGEASRVGRVIRERLTCQYLSQRGRDTPITGLILNLLGLEYPHGDAIGGWWIRALALGTPCVIVARGTTASALESLVARSLKVPVIGSQEMAEQMLGCSPAGDRRNAGLSERGAGTDASGSEPQSASASSQSVARAPQAHRSPTLIAAVVPGDGGGAIVWTVSAGRRIAHVSLFALAFAGLPVTLVLLLYFTPWWLLVPGAAIILALAIGCWCGVWVLVHGLSGPAACICADGTGVAGLTRSGLGARSGSASWRWTEIVSLTCYDQMTPFMSVRLADGSAANIDLTGYGLQTRQEIIDAITSRAKLQQDGDRYWRFVRILEQPVDASGARAEPRIPPSGQIQVSGSSADLDEKHE